MMSRRPRLNLFQSLGPHGFHRVAYTEWGNPSARHIVVCVHGLTRNSRDFDELAADLADWGSRVVCMDVVGRGDSDWLEHKEDYGFSLYLSDAATLLARLTALSDRFALLRRMQGASGELKIDWVGTSMGGLIGMMLAGKSRSPIRRLVLNDVGPLVPWHALARLKLTASGAGARFADLGAVERHLRDSCSTFGPLEDRQWRRLARHGSRQLDDGAYLIGGGWPARVTDHEGNRYEMLDASVTASLEAARAVFPPVGACALARSWAGLEAFTPDDLPILGPVPGISGVLVAAGFSGHGFALSPMIGDILARLALGQDPLERLWKGLRYDRFGVRS